MQKFTIWDIASGKPTRTFTGNGKGKVEQIAISNDQKQWSQREQSGKSKFGILAPARRFESSKPGRTIGAMYDCYPMEKPPSLRSRGLSPAYKGPRREIVCLANTETGMTTHIFEGHTKQILSFAPVG